MVRTSQTGLDRTPYRRPVQAMVRNIPMSLPDRDITTEAEFDSALQLLLLSGFDNGLDLRGAWEYRNGQAYPDLEVIVAELAKQS